MYTCLHPRIGGVFAFAKTTITTKQNETRTYRKNTRTDTYPNVVIRGWRYRVPIDAVGETQLGVLLDANAPAHDTRQRF